MSYDQRYDQRYPFPQVFLVDEGGCQPQPQPSSLPSLVPCWSFPPAQETVRRRGKSYGCMGVSSGAAMVVLLLFMLVFASLGIGAIWIKNLQTELREMKLMVKALNRSTEERAKLDTIIAPQKQIGLYEPWPIEKDIEERPSAHVIGRIQKYDSQKTLRWEPRVGRGFTAGGVTYRIKDGALQVNESGLYHIYSRVELIFKYCSPMTSFVHSVFVRRVGNASPINLMEAHRQGFCSQQHSHAWTTDSYLGSALQLQKYDRVFVNVSHPDFLSHGHYANFFGLYKI